ncbi:MAG TPA: hypothetical protein VHE55_11680 [Fimbriimonadaceae bacterium]|nr:hypothetical protein [Fimbriimonadaceae bacterium]
MTLPLSVGLALGQANLHGSHKATGSSILMVPVAITMDHSLSEQARKALARKHIAVDYMRSSHIRGYVLFATSMNVASRAKAVLLKLQLRRGSLELGLYREGPEKAGKRSYTATIPGTASTDTWTFPTH